MVVTTTVYLSIRERLPIKPFQVPLVVEVDIQKMDMPGPVGH